VRLTFIVSEKNNLPLTRLSNVPLHSRSAYWDGGPSKIKVFREKHMEMCAQNWVCSKLMMWDVVVDGASHDSDASTKSQNEGESPVKRQEGGGKKHIFS